MKQKYYNSGFSIGSRGGGRLYYRSKNVLDHVDVKFRVWYTDGTEKVITRRKNTKDYYYLISFIDKGLEPIESKVSEWSKEMRK